MGGNRVIERQLKALANRRRLDILFELKRRNAQAVSEIARAIRMTVRATSQHLKILRAAGIVIDRKRGLYVYYELAPKQEEIVRSVLRAL